jgi:hypothetical protein
VRKESPLFSISPFYTSAIWKECCCHPHHPSIHQSLTKTDIQLNQFSKVHTSGIIMSRNLQFP